MTMNSLRPTRSRHLARASVAAAAGLVGGVMLAGCATILPAPELSDGDLAAGRSYALGTSAQCHNVTARSPRLFGMFGAPDFYAVANEKTTSGLCLTAFLTTPHPTMPNLIIVPEDRRNVIAHILSLRRAKKPVPTGV